jgi:hypothetical protein
MKSGAPHLWGALLALFAGALESCILFVSTPDEDGGPRCRFAGEESYCGACVKEQCQAEVDACCADPDCGQRLTTLEACTTLHDSSCESLGTDPLGTCIAERCRGRCEPLGGVSRTRCDEPLLAASTACRCQHTPVEGANDHVCSPDVYPATLCCAPSGWPQPGVECSCKPIGCNPTSDGCICSLVDYALEGLARECGGEHCCAADDNCRCGPLPCESWQTPVPLCKLSVLACPAGNASVASCSIRE